MRCLAAIAIIKTATGDADLNHRIILYRPMRKKEFDNLISYGHILLRRAVRSVQQQKEKKAYHWLAWSINVASDRTSPGRSKVCQQRVVFATRWVLFHLTKRRQLVSGNRRALYRLIHLRQCWFPSLPFCVIIRDSWRFYFLIFVQTPFPRGTSPAWKANSIIKKMLFNIRLQYLHRPYVGLVEIL